MKTGRTAPELLLSRKTPDLRKILDLCKTLNICKILPLLDDRNGIHKVSRTRKDKAGRPALDVEEVTVLLSISVKA